MAEAFAFETVTVSTAAVALTAATYSPTNGVQSKNAFLTVEDASLRWRIDGTDPTSTVGHLVNDGDVIEIVGINNVRLFRAIRSGGTDAKLQVTYER